MMVFDGLDATAYDLAATKVTYSKLFKYMMKDFITRKDMSAILQIGNIFVNTQVQVAIPAGTGTGFGVINAKYNGSVPSPQSSQLALQRERDRAAGGAAIDGALGALSEVAG